MPLIINRPVNESGLTTVRSSREMKSRPAAAAARVDGLRMWVRNNGEGGEGDSGDMVTWVAGGAEGRRGAAGVAGREGGREGGRTREEEGRE